MFLFMSSFSGDFIVNAGAPTDATAEKIKVKVKLRVDQNGCFSVSSASMIETLPPAEVPSEEPMETSETNTPVENGTSGGDDSENKENQKDDKMEGDEKQTPDETKVYRLQVFLA